MHGDAEELMVEDTIQMTISYNPSLPGHIQTQGTFYMLRRTGEWEATSVTGEKVKVPGHYGKHFGHASTM